MNMPDVPDPSNWQPRDSAEETIQSAFLKRCCAAERLIKLRAGYEREMNLDNFDSGIGVEDIVREEFRSILPSRYAVQCGVAVDRNGKTSGDHELVVFNDLWCPQVKAGATVASRRIYLPIEGVYAIGEIKQTLDYSTFDAAMQKLVIAHRLTRPPTFAKRLVENRESSACSHGLSNPLYSFILAVNLAQGVTFEELINRFYDINRQVRRSEVVRGLCVLEQGTVVWAFRDQEKGSFFPALFMLDDFYLPIVPAYFVHAEVKSSLFALLANLMLHLFHSVLAPEDLPALYGPASRSIKGTKDESIALPPDSERLASLSQACDEDHRL